VKFVYRFLTNGFNLLNQTFNLLTFD